MPGFGGVLSDRQVATLSTHLLQLYGSREPVFVDRIRELRSPNFRTTLVTATRVALGVVAALVTVGVARAVRRSLVNLHQRKPPCRPSNIPLQ